MKYIKLQIASIYQIWIILFIYFPVITSSVFASDPPDTISFIHITDTHVIFSLPGYHKNIEEKRKHFGEGINPLEDFCKSVQKTFQPDFMVITGDLIDFFEAETQDGALTDMQAEQFLRLMDGNLFPLYLTLGNHDISSYHVSEDTYKADQITAERARSAWIRNSPCFRDGTYYSRILKADSTTYRLIFLDNSYYSPERNKDGELQFIIDKPQLYWLDDQINKSETDVEIIFMHMPITFSDDVFNKLIIAGSSKSDYADLFTVLRKNRSVRMIFMGHNHTNIFNYLEFPDGYKITQVQTAAFGYDRNNWRLIKLTRDNILISNPGKPEIQLNIPAR